MHWLRFVDRHWLIALAGLILMSFDSLAQSHSSVLKNDNWLKVAITKTGIYQLEAADLVSMGWNVSQIKPEGFRLFGNGGKMLAQAIDDFRPEDLIENAIWVTGQEDGKFDNDDRIIFYGQGTNTITFDSQTQQILHESNFYSDTAYYFLTYSHTPGLRVPNAPTILEEGKAEVINEFTDYWHFEKESVNLLESGREWWGDYIAAKPVGWQLKLDGIVRDKKVYFTNQLMAGAPGETNASWTVNGVALGSQKINPVPEGRYALKGRKSAKSYSFLANPIDDILYFEVRYDNGGQGSAIAYLDYLTVQLDRYLDATKGQQHFLFLPAQNDTVQYDFGLQSQPGYHLWDVTTIYTPARLQWQEDGKVTQKTNNGRSFRNLFGFTLSEALKPDRLSKIPNQDIRNIPAADLLIVTAPAFRQEAERLADFRRSHDRLEVEVVTTQDIYNEFSSGKQDVTAIRDFVKILHLNKGLKYLLLFGDASYDFKNIKKGNYNTWHTVPSYQSRESLDPVYSFASDDYYAFLKPGDGDWYENALGDHTMDIGIGRLPVKNVQEAKTVVDKLIHYSSSIKTMGNWRNKASFIADDGDGNLHQMHASSLALLSEGDFTPKLLLNDAFQSIGTGGSRKIPSMNKAILDQIKNGTSLINFSGHGDVFAWTQEQIFTLEEIQKARGYNNLPLFVTATCEFGRFDNPWLVSGAEQLVLSPRGGSIGAVTTTRPVYASNNFALNQAFYKSIAEQGRLARIGDIVRSTKNRSLRGSLNRNFTLLGDPSMRLARALNEVRWIIEPDTLKPLEIVELEGGIFEEGSEVYADWFEGIAQVSVFDQKKDFKTLGNGGEPETYSHFSEKLFEGIAKVSKGRFKLTFRVPAEIAKEYAIGRVSVYAVSSDSLSDASGELKVMVGGEKNVIVQPANWLIEGYMDSPQFVNGDEVSPDPTLWVNVQSAGGINLLGNGIVAMLNDTMELQLNNYYTSDFEDFNSGVIKYQFENLPEGQYDLKLILTDLYNNKIEKTFQFLVGKSKGVAISDVIVYPNPFEVNLGYSFTHNREGDDIQVTFKIYNPEGKLLFTHPQIYYNSEKKLGTTFQPFGDVQKYPSYIFELLVESLTDGARNRRSGWLLQKL